MLCYEAEYEAVSSVYMPTSVHENMLHLSGVAVVHWCNIPRVTAPDVCHNHNQMEMVHSQLLNFCIREPKLRIDACRPLGPGHFSSASAVRAIADISIKLCISGEISGLPFDQEE